MLVSVHFHHVRLDVGALKAASGCQSRHLAGDKDVTQTFLTNHSKKPSLIGPVSEAIKDSNKPIARKAHSGQTTLQIGQPFPSASGNRSIDAARAAAERRWCTALHDRYVATPKIYSEIINAIDPTMQGEATEAEIKRHGAGLAYILNELKVLKSPMWANPRRSSFVLTLRDAHSPPRLPM